MIKRALISVWDKSGIVEFSKILKQKNVQILSTGGTAQLLRENGIKVMDVSNYTGFPEMMDGRVKTLHPKIHGGLLAVRENNAHMKMAKENDVGMIDLVVVNLYPFEETIQKEGVSLEEAIENIDIGGPSMLRSAAKNFKSVTVVTDPLDYSKVAAQIEGTGETDLEIRRFLANKVFALTARYDGLISDFLSEGGTKHIALEKAQDLRYGENPHQSAVFYAQKGLPQDENALTEVIKRQVQGKQLSYNNLVDAHGALSLVREFGEPCVAFLKHSNPCGIGMAKTIEEAYKKGLRGDPKSAFGGVICMNRPCTAAMAEEINSRFFEIVLAPSFEPEALEIFKKKPRLRVLPTGPFQPEKEGDKLTFVNGGYLSQKMDVKQLKKEDLAVVTQKTPTEEEIENLLFAWHVVKHVKSNAIVLAKNGEAVGIGAGQMSRIDAMELAVKKADGKQEGAALASDAFFPFPDTVEAAAQNGIKAIIQPGGSIKDKEVIAAADELGIAMVFTGTRAFLH